MAEQPINTSENTPSRSPTAWGKWVRKISLMAACVYLGGCAIPLFFMQDGMIFPANLAPTPFPVPPFKNVEAVHVDVGLDRPVESWLVWPSAQIANTSREKTPLVVYFHGNGEIIDQEDEPVYQYGKLGWAVLLVEFRGYGRSPGKPSQSAIHDDTLKLLDAVLARPDIDTSRIVFHGRSLGGGVAADIASVRKPCVMILESTFLSMARRADEFYVPRFLVRHPFYSDRVVPTLGVPTFIAHGDHDEVVPFAEGKALAAMTPNAEFFEMTCGHNDKMNSGSFATFWAKVEDFLKRNVA